MTNNDRDRGLLEWVRDGVRSFLLLLLLLLLFLFMNEFLLTIRTYSSKLARTLDATSILTQPTAYKKAAICSKHFTNNKSTLQQNPYQLSTHKTAAAITNRIYIYFFL
jgi:hypothetical protein